MVSIDMKVRYEHEIGRLRRSELSDADKASIQAYIDYKTAQGVGLGRQSYLLSVLRRIALEYSPLSEIESTRVVSVFASIERSPYSERTKYGFKVALRGYLRWSGVKSGIPHIRGQRNRLPDAVITRKDVEQMMAVASVRDRAILAVLYESGMRVGELLDMRYQDIKFDDLGAQLKVSGKTGWRVCRIVWSVPYLAMYIDMTACSSLDYVWRKQNGELLDYFALNKQLRTIAARAGITKRVNPHNFRHSAATNLASKLTESQMSKYLGWVQGSNMPAIYVHMSGRDLDDAILKMYHLAPDVDSNELVVVRCIHCGTVNPIHFRVCHNCWLPLSVEGALHEERELGAKSKQLPVLAQCSNEHK